MTSNSSHGKNQNHPHHSSFPAKGNPYAALSLPNFATPTLIKKQFRQLSLKYHPDKRSSDLNPSLHLEYDRLFMDVQEARDFLLNEEYKTQKQEYDDKLRSDMLRKEEEERREQAMSSKRKRMKQDLEEKIKALSEKHGHGLDDTASSVASSSSIRKRRRQQQQQQAFDNLKRDGMKRRQEFATNQSVMEEKIRMKDLAKQKDILQNRQVRIKWSRKKLGGQSEEMLAKLCKRFGQVENVELIGNKGNAALVTFLEESSCGPCVEFYKTSDELRANFVGKRRRKEQDEEEHRPDHYHDNLNIPSSTADDVLHRHDRDRESVMERKLRQAAEREALLRRMQMGEEWSDDNIEEGGKEGTRNNTTQKRQRVSNRMALLFPPQFPSSSSCRKPIERLQELEQTMLKGLLRPEQIADMQV